MSKYTRRRIANCFKAGIIGGLLSLLSIIEHGQFHLRYPVVGFIAGFFTGVFELFIYRKSLRNINFFLQLIIRSTTYTITVYFTIILFLTLYLEITGSVNARDLIERFMDKELINVLIQAFKGSVLIVFLFQLDDLLGDGTFRRYMSGRYHRPRKQEMVFMFLDIKSSTKLAEELGDEKYYSLIDDFFHDISRPIIECDAEIYKYVGDEVIIMWPMDKAVQSPNCVDLFFMIKQKLRRKKEYYISKYGVVPVFKAGMHGGMVVSALIGDMRKEIVYSGDVLNTSSRLEELCNDYNAELLISDAVYHKLKWTGRYDARSLGVLQLKGKLKPVEVFAIDEH